jgi:hypothetical protein
VTHSFFLSGDSNLNGTDLNYYFDHFKKRRDTELAIWPHGNIGKLFKPSSMKIVANKDDVAAGSSFFNEVLL